MMLLHGLIENLVLIDYKNKGFKINIRVTYILIAIGEMLVWVFV